MQPRLPSRCGVHVCWRACTGGQVGAWAVIHIHWKAPIAWPRRWHPSVPLMQAVPPTVASLVWRRRKPHPMRRRAWGYPVVEYVRLSCTALPLPVVDDGCCAVQLTGGAFCNSGTPYGRFNQDLQRDSTAVASAPVWTWGDTPCSGCVAVRVVCSLPTSAASLRPVDTQARHGVRLRC